jgi:uncharacterized protein
MNRLRFQVSDLIGHSGRSRQVVGELPISILLNGTVIEREAGVKARFDSIPEGILVTAEATTIAHFRCSRCLVEWDGPVIGTFTEFFARQPSDDQYGIAHDGTIDLEPAVHDEVSLAVPPEPLCRVDCAGLCPTCGSDLNAAPCAGHGGEPSSPFAALKQLFGSEG